jgi:hypothetical protein
MNGVSKRQGTAALQDAVATDCAQLLPRGLGVRLSSAALFCFHPHVLPRSLASRCSFGVWILLTVDCYEKGCCLTAY